MLGGGSFLKVILFTDREKEDRRRAFVGFKEVFKEDRALHGPEFGLQDLQS